MIILKHVEHRIKNTDELVKLQIHVMETTSMVDGVDLVDIYFPAEKDEFLIALDCESEDKYREWSKLWSPPDRAKDWYEVWWTKAERFMP